MKRILISSIALVVVYSSTTVAWEQCSDFYCPNGNTCCVNKGCIPNDMGSYNATCCDNEDAFKTGCPVGYECRHNRLDRARVDDQFIKSSIRRTNEGSDGYDNNNFTSMEPGIPPAGFCVANEKDAPMADEFVKVLPRYHLCQVPASMTQLHGFEIKEGTKLGFYSSHGSIENTTIDVQSIIDVEMIWIVIHGSGRNADDYFCSALAAAEMQNQWKDVWVVVPRFFEDKDKPPKDYLFWETNPDDGDGTWRYGANSVNGGSRMNATNSTVKGISSYTALDKLIEHLWMLKLPNLKQIAVAGHSSGGQYVHRWSLLTQMWTDEYGDKMKSIVANPSSYIYITPKRWMKKSQQWELPSASILKDCPNYNKWEWGLDDGGMLQVPYRDDVFRSKSKADVIESFGQRRVIYLSGSLDRCPGEKLMKCHSHGIETTCMDELQGENRFVRGLLYQKSLVQLSLDQRGGWKKHERFIVNGVGHDHSLMWTAEAGINAIFSEVGTS